MCLIICMMYVNSKVLQIVLEIQYLNPLAINPYYVYISNTNCMFLNHIYNGPNMYLFPKK